MQGAEMLMAQMLQMSKKMEQVIQTGNADTVKGYLGEFTTLLEAVAVKAGPKTEAAVEQLKENLSHLIAGIS